MANINRETAVEDIDVTSSEGFVEFRGSNLPAPPSAKRPYKPATPSRFRSPQKPIIQKQQPQQTEEENGEAIPLAPALVALAAENLPAIPIAALPPGGRTTVPTTPATPSEIQRTELVTPAPNTSILFNPIYLLLRPRINQYVRLRDHESRIAAAARLVPALARILNRQQPFDIVTAFNVMVANTDEAEALNAPFNDASVWRTAFRAAFPKFVEQYDADMLPDFFRVSDEERERVEQWRLYYYMVFDLFNDLSKVTIVAVRKAPFGEWREYAAFINSEVSMALFIDTPEKAVCVAPEQFGVVGDIYDIALTTYKPLATDIARYSNIVRWYDVVDWQEFDQNALAISPEADVAAQRRKLFQRRTKSAEDHIRLQIALVPEQFLRTRAVLKIGGHQWWGHGAGLDAIMFESFPDEVLDEQQQLLGARDAELTREITLLRVETNALMDSERITRRAKRSRTEEFPAAAAEAAETTPAIGRIQQIRAAEANLPLVDVAVSASFSRGAEQQQQQQPSELEEKLSELIDLQRQQTEVRNNFSTLMLLRNEETNTVLQFSAFEIAAVDDAIRNAPLRAEKFVVLQQGQQPALIAPAAVAGGGGVARSLLPERSVSPRAIEFSEGDEEDEQEENIDEALRASLEYAGLAPETVNRRVTFQPKFTLLLTHALRYYTGWVSPSNADIEQRTLLEYYAQLDYDEFTKDGIIDSEPTANFILWLMQKQQREQQQSTLMESQEETNGGGGGIDEDPMLALKRANARAMQRIDYIVQKKAFPFLRAFVDDNLYEEPIIMVDEEQPII
jgi:hypothetical protein